MFNLKKIGPATYLMPQEEGMRVPGLIIATEEMIFIDEIQKPLEQVRNVAYLPGIMGHSIAMPDIHWGYGFPIGGVAAMEINHGVISPGGVGYDINCGVRLALIPELYTNLSPKDKDRLIKALYHAIPSGVGHGHRSGITKDHDYRRLLERGAHWSVEQGYGFKEDLENCESHGMIDGADFDAVSQAAKERGKNQLGSIGSGNHFVEIGEIQTIYQSEIAEKWGLFKGQIYALIHSGSRGFGHQVCQDNLNRFIKAGHQKDLPDPQLVAAPIKSIDGQHYFSAMAAAANFAFNNRQCILHELRQSFHEVLNIDQKSIKLLYDVCHNIAKFETYEIDGKRTTLCVHRKGATRAFGPHHPELVEQFKETGQPVLVPGDMARASYVLAGLGNPLTWCSSCHGAGRAKSRHESLRFWKNRDLHQHMKEQGVTVMATSNRTIAEEMPDAYKNVDLVVEAVEEASLAKKVGRLKPHLVIKG